MTDDLSGLILSYVPEDGSSIGNGAVMARLREARRDLTDEDYFAARDGLVDEGRLAKGRGRGGSIYRPDVAPDLELEATEEAEPKAPKANGKARKKAAKPDGPPQVLSYRHGETRVNNPEVGMVRAESDPDGPRTEWSYDPHLDPVLNFDSARAGVERLIDDALASDDPERMRDALAELKRMQAPYLQWTGKAERTSFEVDTVSLHVHERVDPATILAHAAKRLKGKDAAAQWRQADLFAAPFENLPLRQAFDFYRHEKGWSNRLVTGDSLLVMNSLLSKESMGGKVQMIYIDPPYGIKYGSNFQPFTNKRDVKDRSDADLTQEPEMIKAFRDTWELGIHSYLTYLRDRLVIARELLTESGSVFVQISEENVHLVRGLLDEIFGAANFFADIVFVKAGALGAAQLPRRNDYIIWYAKDRNKTKYHQIFIEKDPEEDIGAYRLIEEASGKVRGLKSGDDLHEVRPLRHVLMTKPGPGQKYEYEFRGKAVESGTRWWGFPPESMPRLVKSGRIAPSGKDSKRYLDDFPASYLSNLWTDTATGSGMGKVYVVQTNEKVIERCLLMATDPSDLVLDPTCGSGTTAFVAEKWGRRWITCDTSRVAITLARQRLMTASFDYHALRYPHEGLVGGFDYETVPHITLKSVANNPDIDTIHAEDHPKVLSALQDLNTALQTANDAPPPFMVTAGARAKKKIDFSASSSKTDKIKGTERTVAWALLLGEIDGPAPEDWPDEAKALWDDAKTDEAALVALNARMRGEKATYVTTRGWQPGRKVVFDAPEETMHSRVVDIEVPHNALLEWEVPFEWPVDKKHRPLWPEATRAPFDAFHVARQAMQRRMDQSIADHAEQETLYDKPRPDPSKLRITGPFSVEAVPSPTVQSLEETEAAETPADASVARFGETSRQAAWRDELLKTGARAKGGATMRFAEFETLPGVKHLHASGSVAETGERVVVSFGPEHAALEQRQVELALSEAETLRPAPKYVLFCAFTFDPEAAKDIEETNWPGVTLLKAQMNPDLLTGDLKKKRASNQSFWLMGQPEAELRQRDDGLWEVEVLGFDYFDPRTGDVTSGGSKDIAMWSLDTDYDNRSLMPHQVFFPMADDKGGWNRLKKTVRAELDEDLLEQFHGTVSLPFEGGENGRVAIKIVDDRGIESLKILPLEG